MIDFSKLDKLIHEKGRLGIMTLLASRARAWPFQELKAELDMSDGNLITHLRSLEQAGYIEMHKITGEGRPQTFYSLSKTGKDAFEGYLAVLEQIINLGK